MEYCLDTAIPSEHPLTDAALDQQARHYLLSHAARRVDRRLEVVMANARR